MTRALLASVVCALTLAVPAASAPAMYMDEPGTGGAWGVFYACLPGGCGWWFCWPGEPCRPL